MAVVGNFFYLSPIKWEFLGLESEREGSVCWLNNKIIYYVLNTPLDICEN